VLRGRHTLLTRGALVRLLADRAVAHRSTHAFWPTLFLVLLLVFHKLDELFHAANLIKFAQLFLELALPSVLFAETRILVFEVLLEALELHLEILLDHFLLLCDLVNHILRSILVLVNINFLDDVLHVIYLVFAVHLASFDSHQTVV